ncbi:hypothetical protein EGM70_04785 [Enterobacteriaceae bacterium 89]|nr:hypothetical protein [Enterobacteriaceae bacterium 89]
MAQVVAKKIVDAFNETLGKAVDECRPLSVPERFKIDGALDSMYVANLGKYYALYSAYSSLIGDMKALNKCVDYFFPNGKVNLNSDSYRCLLSMSNATMYEKLCILLDSIDTIPEEYVELYRVHFNAAVTLLDLQKAKEIYSKLPTKEFSEDDLHWFKATLSNVSIFNELHGQTQINSFRGYIIEILKLHSNKIIKSIYEEAGTCIALTIFYPDDDRGIFSIAVEYVSDDVDRAIDLEDDFYQALLREDRVPREALNSIIYSLTPIDTNRANLISERVVGVDFS